jgi:hypothetical protein
MVLMNDFDPKEAKKFLIEREEKEKEEGERVRKNLLAEVISILKKEFVLTEGMRVL